VRKVRVTRARKVYNCDLERCDLKILPGQKYYSDIIFSKSSVRTARIHVVPEECEVFRRMS